ncbi:40S ribosomal protein S29 [Anaeramoeba flamelloides]|uniref:40S ribosomal protein S29 n=1 Tax=Anaeramoeba flamelloides TaxID=1746091 RepID=A0ABQ8YWG2_9EUKA|nr:40S ribosomal protein S29 [Anaeramoeba flamelloides]
MGKTWRNKSKNFGKGSRTCRRCGTHQGLIRKYGMMLCRRCFREKAEIIGFYKSKSNGESNSSFLTEGSVSSISSSTTSETSNNPKKTKPIQKTNNLKSLESKPEKKPEKKAKIGSRRHKRTLSSPIKHNLIKNLQEENSQNKTNQNSNKNKQNNKTRKKTNQGNKKKKRHRRTFSSSGLNQIENKPKYHFSLSKKATIGKSEREMAFAHLIREINFLKEQKENLPKIHEEKATRHHSRLEDSKEKFKEIQLKIKNEQDRETYLRKEVLKLEQKYKENEKTINEKQKQVENDQSEYLGFLNKKEKLLNLLSGVKERNNGVIQKAEEHITETIEDSNWVLEYAEKLKKSKTELLKKCKLSMKKERETTLQKVRIQKQLLKVQNELKESTINSIKKNEILNTYKNEFFGLFKEFEEEKKKIEKSNLKQEDIIKLKQIDLEKQLEITNKAYYSQKSTEDLYFGMQKMINEVQEEINEVKKSTKDRKLYLLSLIDEIENERNKPSKIK